MNRAPHLNSSRGLRILIHWKKLLHISLYLKFDGAMGTLVPLQSRTVGAESLHFNSLKILQMFSTINVFVLSSSWCVVIYDLVFIFKWNFIFVGNLSSTLIAETIKKNVLFDLLNNLFHFLADATAFQDNLNK